MRKEIIAPGIMIFGVIALAVFTTSLAGEEDVTKGKEVGIDDYQIKLDKLKLVERIKQYL